MPAAPPPAPAALRVGDQIARILDRIGWGAVLVAVAFVPLAYLGGGRYQQSLPKLTVVLWCAALVMATVVARWILVRPRLPRPHLVVPIIALAGLTIVAAGVGVSPARSLLGINGRYAGVVPLLALIVVCLGIVAFTWDRPTRLWSLVLAGAASGAVGAVAIVLARLGVSLPGSPAGSRPNGLLGNADFSGAHLALMLPLVVVARRRLPDRWSTPMWVVAGLCGVAIVSTQSRGAILAAVVAVAVLGLVDRDLLARPVALVARVVAVGALAVVLVGSAVQWGGGTLPLPSGGLLGSGTLSTRVDYWAGATQIVRDHPALGTGPDTFSLSYPGAARPTAKRVEPQVQTAPSGQQVVVTNVVLASSPHDIYLERAAGSGLLGVLAYLSVIVGALVYARRAVRSTRWGREPGHPRRVLRAAFVAMLAGYLTQGITSIDIVPMALLGWVALGGIVALADPGVRAARLTLLALGGEVAMGAASAGADDGDDGDDGANEEVRDPIGSEAEDQWRRDPSVVGLVAAGVVGVATVVVLAMALGPLRADRDLAAVTAGNASTGAFIAALDSVIASDPYETDLVTRAVAAEGGRARTATPADRDRLLAAALAQVDAALDRAPDDLDLLSNRAGLLRKQGEAGDLTRFAAADDAYRRLAEVDPYGPDVDVLWARLLMAWSAAAGHDPALAARASATADRAETKVQNWATGWYDLALVRQDLGDRADARAAVAKALEIEPDLAPARTLAEQLAGPG